MFSLVLLPGLNPKLLPLRILLLSIMFFTLHLVKCNIMGQEASKYCPPYTYSTVPHFCLLRGSKSFFVENADRNAILTFPYDDDNNHTPHVNSSLVQPMGTTFLKAIVICLLSQRVSLEGPMKAVALESSQVKETPKRAIIKPKYFDTPDEPKRQSPSLQKATVFCLVVPFSFSS
jgi:hypothetical protein